MEVTLSISILFLLIRDRKRDIVEKVIFEGILLAIIIRSSYRQPGISFFTPGELSQQLAYMQHPAGHVIEPHVHNRVIREVHYTQEVLVLRKGRLRVDFYDTGKRYVESRVLDAGDVILLATGGHGFEVLDDVEMFEIKQGPYVGEQDKTRFTGIPRSDVNIVND